MWMFSGKARSRGRAFFFSSCLSILWLALGAGPSYAQSGDATRGEYLAKAGGCLGCHTEAKQGATPFAGGRELKSPFGNFYGPNITPHSMRGIGAWSEADFFRAMREGRRPDGANYFPAFPYTSFTKISDADLKDLWGFLRTLPPSEQASRPHDLPFPFNLRFAVWFWKLLNFTAGNFTPNPAVSPAVNRGAYVVEALGHCGECHTPRDFLGGLKTGSAYAGSASGPGGGKIPNITPTALAKWSDGDLKEFLGSGMTPDGDFAGGEMAEVIRNSTSKLTAEDLAAIVAYLRTLNPQ